MVTEWPNTLHRAISAGIDPNFLPAPQILEPDYTAELAIIEDTNAVIDRLDMVFAYGTLKDETREIIRATLEDWPIAAERRLWSAIYIVMTSPEYMILR